MAESVANADVVITMVPDSPDVEGVVTGEDGVGVLLPTGLSPIRAVMTGVVTPPPLIE